jgi:ribosomal protein S18 acetylase RimI-like enzyme
MPDWIITPAGAADLEAIEALVNGAYRGPASRAGWTTEADYLDGQRTSVAALQRDLAGPSAPRILVLRRAQGGEILACVLVELIWRAGGGSSGYIGMLTVKPGLQNGGIGRIMLRAAEDEARRCGADRACMTVVQVRDTLIAWYERRGYRRTGETTPFPYDDGRFGAPRRDDLFFVVLVKPLGETQV